MLGWEFPPFISGGLGTACYGLTKAMSQLGLEIIFCLPKIVEQEYATHVSLRTPNSLPPEQTTCVHKLTNVTFRPIPSFLQPYARPTTSLDKRHETILREQQGEPIKTMEAMDISDYNGDMYAEVHRYAAIAVRLSEKESFDIVHAHDWMTYPAGIAVSSVSGKPLIVHIHSTEYDRSGEHVNPMIYDIERKGMQAADKVIAVSHLTRNTVVHRYGIDANKVKVVHNGIEHNTRAPSVPVDKEEKIVLFLGRITMQKGPEYFLRAAKKVLEVMEDVKFVMAGSGDMMHRSIEMAAELGIGSKVLFTGFLRGEAVQKIYRMADLFVMPSVSEPFGLVPLEAMENDVPVIISRQSGVSEVLTHALKVDFWDTEEMANKILAVLQHKPLKMTLQNHGNYEVRKIRWEDSAVKCAKVYEEALIH